MKKMMTLVACFLFIAATNAQTLNALFDKYSEDERFEYVSVGKGMMSMAKAFINDAGNGASASAMDKIKGLKILTISDSSDVELTKKVINELDKILKKENFETVMEARDKGERVNIYSQTNKKNSSDMLIVTHDNKGLSMIWMNGDFSKEDLASMAGH